MQKKQGLLQERLYTEYADSFDEWGNGEYHRFNNKGRHAYEKYKRNRGFFYKSE